MPAPSMHSAAAGSSRRRCRVSRRRARANTTRSRPGRGAVDTGIAGPPCPTSTAGVPGSHSGRSSTPRNVPRMELSHHRAGSGDPIVLIHGVGSQWQVWEPVLETVAREREVIAVDLPGFGDSPTLPIGTVPTVDALADAVAAFLDGLGIEKPVIAGNSLGGWIALELAARGRAKAVVGV